MKAYGNSVKKYSIRKKVLPALGTLKSQLASNFGVKLTPRLRSGVIEAQICHVKPVSHLRFS